MRLPFADGVRALGAPDSGAVDMDSQDQEMVAVDDMHLAVADSVDRRFWREEGIDRQDGQDPNGSVSQVQQTAPRRPN